MKSITELLDDYFNLDQRIRKIEDKDLKRKQLEELRKTTTPLGLSVVDEIEHKEGTETTEGFLLYAGDNLIFEGRYDEVLIYLKGYKEDK